VEPKQDRHIYLCNKIFAIQPMLTDNPCMSQEACEYEPWSWSPTQLKWVKLNLNLNPTQISPLLTLTWTALLSVLDR